MGSLSDQPRVGCAWKRSISITAFFHFSLVNRFTFTMLS